MKLPALEKLGGKLEEPAHLVVWEDAGRIEVIAVAGESFQDAFPLPLHVQAAAAEAEMILDTTTAARLEIDKLPKDFWEGLEEIDYSETLRVSFLGRPGQKYLHLYRAVRKGDGEDLAPLKALALTEVELLKVTQWMREQALFEHQSGDVLMKILTRLPCR